MDLSKYTARRDDPAESKDAAAKAAPRAPQVRLAVERVMTEDGPGTLDQIVSRFNRRAVTEDGWPRASASSIRTRVSELVRDGRAEQVPDEFGRSAMGNRAAIWRARAVQGSQAIERAEVDA